MTVQCIFCWVIQVLRPPGKSLYYLRQNISTNEHYYHCYNLWMLIKLYFYWLFQLIFFLNDNECYHMYVDSWEVGMVKDPEDFKLL